MKVGILGGGQLGRMLLQQAANYPVQTWVMENDDHCPAAYLCHHFIKGDIRDFDSVYQFGKQVDALTIEIENVNVEALEKLESEGLKIYPRPSALKTIKSKILQKEFYKQFAIPTPEFHVVNTLDDAKALHEFLPAVQKLGMGGYDGRGVQVLQTTEDYDKGFDAPSVLEKLVAIDKEISVIVAVNDKGSTTLYPPVEMVFDPYLNILDYQIAPADIPERILWKVEAIAMSVARNLRSPGIFAVEMFIDKKGEVYVNETAPRVHNSGHHTIEAHYCSQFDMLWRIILNYPMGVTDAIMPSLMINILGAEGYSGEPCYEGINEALEIQNVFIHIYGKRNTKPGRKMGHVTILGKNKQDLVHEANKIKRTLLVKSK
ncbi:MAG: 5-(carboxyamino)imidazole ribonucleotide synthase [Chitinophagaceae bacterium]|nr:5-(carboxyamino)imidazole ribonucleotide synthase [Chitinophagaceae bacterium]